MADSQSTRTRNVGAEVALNTRPLSALHGVPLTDTALSEESTRFRRGGWGRRVLDLRGGGSARLAHRVCAMHDGWLCLKVDQVGMCICEEGECSKNGSAMERQVSK